MWNVTTDDLIRTAAGIQENFVWLMDIDKFKDLRFTRQGDDAGNPIWLRDDSTGYGRLLGHRIVIVDFPYFGVGRF